MGKKVYNHAWGYASEYDKVESKKEAESLIEANKIQLKSAEWEVAKCTLLLLILIIVLVVAYILFFILIFGMPVYWFNHENLSAMAVFKQSLGANAGKWSYVVVNFIIIRKIALNIYENSYKLLKSKRDNIQNRIWNLEKQLKDFDKEKETV